MGVGEKLESRGEVKLWLNRVGGSGCKQWSILAHLKLTGHCRLASHRPLPAGTSQGTADWHLTLTARSPLTARHSQTQSKTVSLSKLLK